MKKLEISKKLLKFKKGIYTLSDLKKILGLKNNNSTYKSIERLKKDGVIDSYTNGIYYLPDNPLNDFFIAN